MPPPARVLPAPPAPTLPTFVAGHAVMFLTMLAPVLVSAQAVTKPADAVSANAVGRAVVEIERLDALRSTLAATFAQTGAPVDKPAFNAVCAPVGRAMKEAAAANRWQARQIAVKNRNPANVTTEFPNDRAFGFRAGDLRGAYSVFIPGTR